MRGKWIILLGIASFSTGLFAQQGRPSMPPQPTSDLPLRLSTAPPTSKVLSGTIGVASNGSKFTEPDPAAPINGPVMDYFVKGDCTSVPKLLNFNAGSVFSQQFTTNSWGDVGIQFTSQVAVSSSTSVEDRDGVYVNCYIDSVQCANWGILLLSQSTASGAVNHSGLVAAVHYADVVQNVPPGLHTLKIQVASLGNTSMVASACWSNAFLHRAP